LARLGGSESLAGMGAFRASASLGLQGIRATIEEMPPIR